MAAYIPFAGKNSIVEVALGLQFASPILSQESDVIERLKDNLVPDFPSFEPIQQFQVNLGGPMQWAGDPLQSPRAGGFQASRIKPDGKPIKIVRGVNNMLSAHFFDYDNWIETKREARGYFNRCFELLRLPSTSNAIIGSSVTFVDRFTLDGEPSQATASMLFDPSTSYVSRKIFDVGAVWHSHSGWFEESPICGRTLNQLQVQSMIEGSRSSAVVHHSTSCTFKTPFDSIETIEGQGGSPRLAEILDEQHECNSGLLKDLLNEEILKTIGLVG